MQDYAKLLPNDPITTLKFCHDKVNILHALSLNMQPDLTLAKAIKTLSPNDAMDIAPFVISQIPTQPLKPIRIHLLTTLFNSIDLKSDEFMVMLYSAKMQWFV